MEIIGREVLYENRSFRRVRDYVSGHHPELGILHNGWSGDETIIERDVITPIVQFDVTEKAIQDIQQALRLLATPLKQIGDEGNEGSF